MFDRGKTLQELDGEEWGELEWQSGLVLSCHRLRHKPVAEFTAEDVRIIVGQGFSLEYLAPVALEMLEADPFVEGDYYPGDLMSALVGGRAGTFWEDNPDLAMRLSRVLSRVHEELHSYPKDDRDTVEEIFRLNPTKIDKIQRSANKLLHTNDR